MDATAYQKAQADAAALMAANDISLYSIIFDPVFFFLLAGSLLFLGVGYWQPVARRYAKKQSDYLDHQRDINEKALAQNRAMEELIAKQYADSNARSDQALLQSAEAVRLHAEAVEQLRELNASISRLAAQLDTGQTGRRV